MSKLHQLSIEIKAKNTKKHCRFFVHPSQVEKCTSKCASIFCPMKFCPMKFCPMKFCPMKFCVEKCDFDFSPITIASNKIHLNHVGFFLIKVKQSKYVFPLLKSSPKTIYSLEENFYFTSYLFTAS